MQHLALGAHRPPDKLGRKSNRALRGGLHPAQAWFLPRPHYYPQVAAERLHGPSGQGTLHDGSQNNTGCQGGARAETASGTVASRWRRRRKQQLPVKQSSQKIRSIYNYYHGFELIIQRFVCTFNSASIPYAVPQLFTH